MKIANALFVSPLLLAASLTSGFAHEDSAAVDSMIAMFDDGVIVGDPKIVDCTLSGGTKTSCLSIMVKSNLTENDMGPWCPRNISDGPDEAGIWLHEGKRYDADGEFVENLATFYGDPDWQMFDPANGNIRVTDSKAACEAAARPDVDAAYNNYCVECLTSYMDEDVLTTYVLPLHPVDQKTPSRVNGLGGIGLAFNGIKFDAPAPVDAILAAHTLAPFDDCGGHVNLHAGYHYHAAGGCSPEVTRTTGHAAIIGIALDGYPMTSRVDADGSEPSDLDACRGHFTDGLGYHYHVNEIGSNQTIGCFVAETGCSLDDPDQICDASIVSNRRGPPPGE